VVDALEAGGVELVRRVQILDEAPLRETADRLEGAASVDDAVATRERRVRCILRRQLVLVEEGLQVVEYVLSGKLELLRRRDECDVRVLEVTERLVREVGIDTVISVDYTDELGVGVLQRVVEIAGLPPPPFCAGEATSSRASSSISSQLSLPAIRPSLRSHRRWGYAIAAAALSVSLTISTGSPQTGTNTSSVPRGARAGPSRERRFHMVTTVNASET
jgi:hypothetical protein